jgi:hypothetical protein
MGEYGMGLYRSRILNRAGRATGDGLELLLVEDRGCKKTRVLVEEEEVSTGVIEGVIILVNWDIGAGRGGLQGEAEEVGRVAGGLLRSSVLRSRPSLVEMVGSEEEVRGAEV